MLRTGLYLQATDLSGWSWRSATNRTFCVGGVSPGREGGEQGTELPREEARGNR